MSENILVNGIDLITIEEHYLFWWLGRYPSQKDFNKINNFMRMIRAIPVNVSKNSIELRMFIEDTISVHIIISRKFWGFSINTHIDIGIHYRTIFNIQTLKILSKLYVHLNKVSYGKCFLLPRQEQYFKKFMKQGKKRWNLI